MANVLIIDDEANIRDILAQYATKLSCNVAVAGSLREGFEVAAARDFDLVFLDVRLPDGDGLDALPRFRRLSSEPEVIIITGMDPEKGAEQAIKSGAWDYVQKPFHRDEIVLHLTRALEFREKKSTLKKISLRREDIIGRSRELEACIDRVAQCAGNDVNVLITGETGTGKELFAQTIHRNSSRAGKGFIVVDCAALPENLMESILCGHKKGAFTGADHNHTGLVKQADGGTLFLDEVGELPVSFQKKFLRILQERRFRPIGSDVEIESDFRLISATNKDLDLLEKEHKFRKDLIYRLRTIELHIPPLRERTDDIRDLVQHFILKISEKHGVGVKGFMPEFISYLTAYPWPGNVRELVNCLEEAVLTHPEDPSLYHKHLPVEIRVHHAKTVSNGRGKKADRDGQSPLRSIQADISSLLDSVQPFGEFKQKITEISEYQYLRHLMAWSRNNVKKACEMSRLSQSRLYALLRKYRLK